MLIPKAARIIERRRNFLNATIAQADEPVTWDIAEAEALDCVLAALYERNLAPRAPGMSPSLPPKYHSKKEQDDYATTGEVLDRKQGKADAERRARAVRGDEGVGGGDDRFGIAFSGL